MDPPGDTRGNGVDDRDVLILSRGGFDSTTATLWSPVTRTDIAWSLFLPPSLYLVSSFSPSLPLFHFRNFEKFLVDGNGQVVRRYSRFYPTLNISQDIDELLGIGTEASSAASECSSDQK
jgi:hypothetical protein